MRFTHPSHPHPRVPYHARTQTVYNAYSTLLSLVMLVLFCIQFAQVRDLTRLWTVAPTGSHAIQAAVW